MPRSKNTITELSEIIAKTLVKNPEVSEKLSALMGGRMSAASLEGIKIKLTKHELKESARRLFNRLHEKQQLKSNSHA